MSILLSIATVSLAVTAAVCLYHLGLGAVAMCSRRSRPTSGNCGAADPAACAGETPAPQEAVHRFAIVIPAHDEEALLPATLRGCQRLDYPASMYRVYVIADNCCDRTAEVAAAHGVRCLVRNDPARPGKGCALEWALPQVLDDGCDAVFVLDADCEVSPNALRRCDERLRAGDCVLQASPRVANADETPMTYALAVANVLENDLFYAPKSRLGLAVFLRGTGMLLHRDVLRARPWRARSIVEDVEYTCQLLEDGIRVRFLGDVSVTSRSPARHRDLAVQRSRWIGGSVLLSKRMALGLAWRGLRRGRLRLLDAAVTMLVLSRPLVVLQWALSLALAAVCAWVAPGGWSAALLSGSTACAAGYGLYVAAGALALGVTQKRLRLAAQAPLVATRYLGLALSALGKGSPSQWNRTPRQHEAPSN